MALTPAQQLAAEAAMTQAGNKAGAIASSQAYTGKTVTPAPAPAPIAPTTVTSAPTINPAPTVPIVSAPGSSTSSVVSKPITTTVAPVQNQILNLEAMKSYNPSQYTRLADGAVVLNAGVTPLAGTTKTYGGSVAATTPASSSYVSSLSPQVLTGLSAADTRRANGTANATDLSNLAYAESKGWVGTHGTNSTTSPTASVPKASYTLYNPITGDQVTVEVGSAKAQELLKGGYQVGTTTSSFGALGVDVPGTITSGVLGDAVGGGATSIYDINAILGESKKLQDAYTASLQLTPLEIQINTELNKVRAGADLVFEQLYGGLDQIADEPIAMPFITGQQASIQRSSQRSLDILSRTEGQLIDRLGLAQDARIAASNAAKNNIDAFTSNVNLGLQIQNSINDQQDKFMTRAQDLQDSSRGTLTTILSMFQGLDFADLSSSQQQDLTTLATQSNVPVDLLVKGMEVAKTQYLQSIAKKAGSGSSTPNYDYKDMVQPDNSVVRVISDPKSGAVISSVTIPGLYGNNPAPTASATDMTASAFSVADPYVSTAFTGWVDSKLGSGDYSAAKGSLAMDLYTQLPEVPLATWQGYVNAKADATLTEGGGFLGIGKHVETK